MKPTRKNSRKRNNLVKRAISLLISASMLFASIYVKSLDGVFDIDLPYIVHASNETSTIKHIQTLEELYDFSNSYATNSQFAEDNKTDELIIHFIDTWVLENNHSFSETVSKSYIPIGTDDNPFMGKITIDQVSGSVVAIQSTMPIFDVVYDSVDIVNQDEQNQCLSIIRSETMSGNVPLFANKVQHDTRSSSTSSTWDIMASPYNSYAHDFSGIIGTIEEGCNINIDFDFAACASSHDANIISDSSTGLICGVMQQNSTVDFTLKGSSLHTLRTGYSVSTSGNGKSAGSLVGEMNSDSVLNVYLEPDSLTSSNYYNLQTAKTISATGSDSYAGGLVGKCAGGTVCIYKNEYGAGNALTQTRQSYISQDNVSAGEAAGGIFGKYLAIENGTFNDYYGANGCTVSAKNAGGLVGIFDAGNKNISFLGTNASSHFNVNVVVADTRNVDWFGGLFGKYLSTDLSKTLNIEHVSVALSKSGSPSASSDSVKNAFGGVIGFVDGSDSTHTAVYIKADDISVTVSSGHSVATYFGGLFGKTGTKGSLLDVGSFKLKTTGDYKGGGVVGYLDRGVLRLSGKTDLTEAAGFTDSSTVGSNSRGQLVGQRGASLVYALGTGEETTASYENGWRFERYTGNQYADDIGTWGEVVRLNKVDNGTLKNIEDTTTGSETKALTYDSSAHTVTVDSPVLEMTTKQDIVKTALNMQLNTGDCGALCFNDSSNTSVNLLKATNLTISGEISLSGTGITSLTRDDAVNNAFSGKISGVTGSSTDKIILSTGEKYGICIDGKTGTGEIYTHQYNGLFAEIGGGTIEKLTIGGELDCDINLNTVLIGGVAADITGGMTISNCIVSEKIDYRGVHGSNHYVGGLAGRINSNNGNSKNISVSNSTISPNVVASGSLGDTLKIAGGIAYVDSTSSFSMGITNSSLAFKVNGTSATSTNADLHMAGLIADIKYKGAGASDDTRKVILSGNTFSGCEVKNNATTTTGGMLGYSWLNTDTELTNNTFSATNVLWTDATKFSALCYKATGYWQVKTNGLKVDSLAIKDKNGNAIASNHVTEFGFVVDYGYHEESEALSSLYLENTTAESYSLGASGVIVPGMTSGIYDEFVAYSGKSILDNNNGVISICLSEDFKMDGTNCNSYQNKFNKTLKNEKSRYYYNVAAHKTGFTSGQDGWKLLIWSLNKYASTNIQRCFTNPFSGNTISGIFDMNGISYYPIDIASGTGITLGDTSSATTFTFYNEQIEKAEGVTAENGNTDGLTRTTVAASQHYLMHSGLFKKMNGSISAVGAVTFAGSVGKDNTYSGVLINHSLNGSLTTTKNKNITFNNLSLRGTSGNKDDNGYLFIHSINSNSSLTLNSVRLSGYTDDGTTFASSLIGDVVGNDINLKLDDIKIDGRNATGKTNLSGLTTVYGTSRSIFTNASLLNKFDVNTNSVAIYNFEVTEDWTGSSHTPGNVTYGRELTDSVEYANLEKKYYASTDTGRKYVNPKDTPTTSEYAAGFSSDFLPYVRYFSDKNDITGYTPPSSAASIKYREIKVNVLSTDLTVGCGTYDHPYVISTPTQLQDIATMINGGSNLPNICLPKTVSLHSDSSYNHWCLDDEGNHTCSSLYTCPAGNTTYTSTADGASNWTAAQVREYLCGAYYQIQGELTLASSFVGLGATTGNSDGKYAFRGVIVGASGAKIINNTTAPLIKVSNGSVVKNLEMEIKTSTNNVVTTAAKDSAFSYGQTGFYYGGVIGEIMGGDNIIDNVKVSYDDYLRVGSTGQYLYTIGGYVGVIVNGGLIFRNMPTNPLNNEALTDGSFLVGANTAANSYSKSTNYSHLYINPFVGRVINGYAINETSSYSGDTGTYTLDNSNKNYRIADVNKTPGDNIITFGDFTATNAKDKLCIPDGQSLFMLSLITQSGAGSAPSANGAYVYGVAYDGSTERYDTNSAAQYAATHLANYNYVGDVTNGDNSIKADANTDWTASCRDRVNSTTCVPYIISKYTSGSGDSYLARTVTNLTYMIELTTTGGDYKLPECFRGIGAICRFESGVTTSELIVNAQTDQKVTSYSDEDGKFSMKIYGLKGNNARVSINLYYRIYSNTLDNYIYTVYKSTAIGSDNNTKHVNNCVNIGFGLFNYVKQIPQSGYATLANTESGYYIGDFTLTGNIYVKEYNNSGTEQGNGGKAGNNFLRNRHSVGGIIGALCIDEYINFVRLDLDDITISGPSMVGGYIGRVNITERNMTNGYNMNYIFVNGCDTKSTIIKSKGGYCGGIVAGSCAGFMTVKINTETNSSVSDTKHKGADNRYKSTMEISIDNTFSSSSSDTDCGTGGVIGSIRNGHSMDLWLNNLTISGYSKEGVCEPKIYSSNTAPTSGVGGLIGYVRKANSVIITNTDVYNLSIEGASAGGLFGYIDKTSGYENFGVPPMIKIANCNIYSDKKSSGYSITSAQQAGGISGGFITDKDYNNTIVGYDDATYKYDIDGVNVYNYTISGATSCGGLIGEAKNGKRSIVNSSVHDCTLRCADGKAVGGIVGKTTVEVDGYNISSYNNVFAGRGSTVTTSATKGNFIGTAGSAAIKIVAFSRKDNTYNGSGLSDDIGSGTNSNNYIVCSDYKGVSETLASANKAPSNMTDLPIANTLADVSAGARGDYFPYANVNPRTNMGADGETQAFFTSDGIALYSVPRTDPDTGDPVIDEQTGEQILDYYAVANAVVGDKNAGASDTLYNSSLYNKAYTGAYSGTDSTTNGAYVKKMLDAENDDVRLSTYENEMGLPDGYNGADFPVIALGGAANNYEYTAYIESYIRLMTNTTDAYTSASSGSKYKIKIWPCRYDSVSGQYSVITNEADANKSIYISGSKYYMRENKADSLNKDAGQFTVIDVQFLNPMNNKEVAYHLFVPVLTQKMAKFEFHSDVKQGADYVVADYDEISENNVYAGNFDTWTTAYVQFKYTAADINTILNTGRGLNWNSDKVVTFNYASDKDVADGTQFVLLDANKNRDRAYYLNKTSSMTTSSTGSYPKDNIVFTDFKEKDGTTAFEPVSLYDLAGDTIRYSQNESGKYYEVPAGTSGIIACAYDSNGANVKYFKEYTSGSAARYDLTATQDIVESYYISMYAYSKDNTPSAVKMTDNAYAFTISCPTTLDGLVTSRKRAETNTNVYFGKMFEQTLEFSNQTANVIVSKDNHELTVTMTSTVRFADTSNKTYFQNKLHSEHLDLYQGFLLDMNKHDYQGHITGNSRLTEIDEYTWSISTSSDPDGSRSGREINLSNVPYVYVEPVCISIPSASQEPNWYSRQEATVTIKFTSDEDSLAEDMFMSRIDSVSRAGSNFHASANLDFSETGLEYSNLRLSKEDTSSHRYYMRREESLDLMLTAEDQSLPDEYDKNGELSQNFSSLGVNAKYIDTGKKYSENYGNKEHIEAIANIDVSSLPNTYLDGNHSLRLTLTLNQKQDSGSSGYSYVDVPIDTYLQNFKLLSKDANNDGVQDEITSNAVKSVSNGDYIYTFDLTDDPSTWLINYDAEEKLFDARVAFDVITADDFEDITEYLYSNYKLEMTAEIVDTATGNNVMSSDLDWIVYTHAKVNAQFVTPVVQIPNPEEP